MNDIKITYEYNGKKAYWFGKLETLKYEIPTAKILKTEPIK